MSSAEQESRAARRAPSWRDFPRRASRDDVERNLRRKTLPPQRAEPDAGIVGAPAPRDPLLVAMPSGAKRALVFEASAIRDSALGRLFMECMLSSRDLERLQAWQADAGVDFMRGIDRVGVADRVAVISGDFANARWENALATHAARPFHRATIYEPKTVERRRRVIGTWGPGMVVVGRSTEEVEQAILRLEGRAPASPPIDESDAYGEIYGVVAASELVKLLPEDVQGRLRGAADRVELHVDTREENDVLIVLDTTGSDNAAVDDFGKSLGAALAVARVKARHDGDDDLAELLDLARVRPETGAFRLEVGLPLELLRKRFGYCREDAGPGE
jgi:hypothetical protein